jgi:hypothetical protein
VAKTVKKDSMRILFLLLSLLFVGTAIAQQVDYVVLAAVEAQGEFDLAARHLENHHHARLVRFQPGDLEPVRQALENMQPRYVALVMRPEQIDFAFQRRFLQLASEIDDDPFVDFAFGYITGIRGEEALALAKRGTDRLPKSGELTHTVVAGGVKRSVVRTQGFRLRDRMLDTLRIYTAGEDRFPETGRDRKFLAKQLPRVSGRDTLTFVGHGYPREVHGGPDYRDLKDLDLTGTVALNVACYTGTTHRYFDSDWQRRRITEEHVPFEESFCLTLLQKGVVGYTAYVCPRPAGPELDTDLVALIVDGMSLGTARRRDYDKTVLGYLGFGEERMVLREIKNNDPVPQNIDAVRDMMLEGATGGVLFGDPACVPFAGLKDEGPLKITIKEEPTSPGADGQFLVRAKAGVHGLYLQCSDPTARWESGMAMKVYTRIPLSDRLVRDVVIDRLAIDGKVQPTRVLWAIENDHGDRFLQLKVNFPRPKMARRGLALSLHVATTSDASLANNRGGEVQHSKQPGQPAARDPFAIAAKRSISGQAIDAALAASGALLQRNPDTEAKLVQLAKFGSEGFQAVCVLLEAGNSHWQSWRMLEATWHPGDEKYLIALASGDPLANYASWSVLEGLGVADTPQVRALLLNRLETEVDAGLYMATAKGLAHLDAKEAVSPIAARLLEYRESWGGVAPHLIRVLAVIGGQQARACLVTIAASKRDVLAKLARSALDGMK